MSQQVLVRDKGLLSAWNRIVSGIESRYQYSKSVEELFDRSIENFPKLLVLQHDFESHLRMIDVVRDLRMLFGSAPTIVMLGRSVLNEQMAHFLDIGADNFFCFPFDMRLVESFLSKNLRKSLCLPFKYRSVPSGGTPVVLELDISLVEVNSNGIIFESDDLLTKGLIFRLNLAEHLMLESCLVKVRVLRNLRNDDDVFEYHAEYFELDAELKRKIVHRLKEFSKE